MRKFLYLFFGIIIFSACNDSRPTHVMNETKMENFLYDYQLATLTAQYANDSSSQRTHLYVNSILKKYSVTKEDFDSSMVWYSRHAKKLYDIYGRLAARYAERSKVFGESMREHTNFANLVENSDSVNIWKGMSSYLLSQNDVTNRLSFSILPDSSMIPKDKLEWHFRTIFIYKEGKRLAQSFLKIEYTDSTFDIARRNIYSSDEHIVKLTLKDKPLKRLSGFIYLDEPWNRQSKYLHIDNIALICIHPKDVKKKNINSPNTIK